MGGWLDHGTFVFSFFLRPWASFLRVFSALDEVYESIQVHLLHFQGIFAQLFLKGLMMAYCLGVLNGLPSFDGGCLLLLASLIGASIRSSSFLWCMWENLVAVAAVLLVEFAARVGATRVGALPVLPVDSAPLLSAA